MMCSQLRALGYREAYLPELAVWIAEHTELSTGFRPQSKNSEMIASENR